MDPCSSPYIIPIVVPKIHSIMPYQAPGSRSQRRNSDEIPFGPALKVMSVWIDIDEKYIDVYKHISIYTYMYVYTYVSICMYVICPRRTLLVWKPPTSLFSLCRPRSHHPEAAGAGGGVRQHSLQARLD